MKIVMVVICSLLTILYPVYLFLNDVVFGVNMWIGFAFTVVGYLFILATIVKFDSKKHVAYPRNISLIVLTCLYYVITICLNTKFGYAVKIADEKWDFFPTKQFILYEIIAFVIFIVLYLIIISNKKHTTKTNSVINNNINNISAILAEVEIIKEKANNMYDSKLLVKKLNGLYDDIKFSNIKSDEIHKEYYEELIKLVNRLKSEVNNALEIETCDYTSIDDLIGKVRELLIKNNY